MMPTHLRLTPEPGEAGLRLDVLIPLKFPEISRSAAQRLIESGMVTRGGEVLRKNHRAVPGFYEIAVPELAPAIPAAEDIPLDVVFEDCDVIVVNKPKGMVVHPAPGHGGGTLVNALLHRCGSSLSGIGGVMRPGIVHRLDKDTSGLIIAAKNDAAHKSLSEQLASRSLKRIYEAVVRGTFKQDCGTVNAPVGRNPRDRKKMAVTHGSGSKPAVTHFETIAAFESYTHLRCRLETGRTHQIRVHMAHIGHPVAGDAVYGAKKPELGLDSQCLHARSLTFTHPRNGQSIELICSLPGYFTEVLQKLAMP